MCGESRTHGVKRGKICPDCHASLRGKSDILPIAILQAGVPRKYYLTAKACRGILQRASKRGKELPTILRKALERQAAEMES